MKKQSILVLCLLFFLVACQAKTATPQANLPASPAPSSTPVISPTPAASAIPAGCTVISPRPTPGPTQDSLFPPVSKDDWVQGPADASVTLLEYSDFM